jgi:hypothetical protein
LYCLQPAASKEQMTEHAKVYVVEIWKSDTTGFAGGLMSVTASKVVGLLGSLTGTS